MFKAVLTIFTLTLGFASAEVDVIQRRWTIPELTPVIESFRKPDKSDPFASLENFKAIESFDKDQLVD